MVILYSAVKILEHVSFVRRISVDECYDMQLHGFCDASNIGYSACLYIRACGKDDKIIVRLLCSKSRVAPLKSITIPRLELCDALLLARLYTEANEILKIESNKTTFWCDSNIALHWINTSPHLLKPFVANRVSEIQELTRNITWKHVRSEENSADALSRGQLPLAFSKNKTWVSGPLWLNKKENYWPDIAILPMELLELRSNTALVIPTNGFDLLKRYSSYAKLIRIVAYWIRLDLWYRKQRSDPLTAIDFKDAEKRILKICQAEQYSDVIKNLRKQKDIKTNRIANLNPFLDVDGLIRVGGRLQKSNLTFAQKHPILLPSYHPVTDIIIREIH